MLTDHKDDCQAHFAGSVSSCSKKTPSSVIFASIQAACGPSVALNAGSWPVALA